MNSITFSPSGNLLASSSSDKTVRLWLPNATGDNVVLRGHSASVRHVDFSPHNKTVDNGSSALLLTCSDDKTIKVWKLPHKKFQRSLIGHANWVRCCKFSPDTPQLAGSCGDDGTVRLWDIDRGHELTSYRDCQSGVNVVDFISTGNVLASGANEGGIRLYDVRTDKLMQYYPTNITDGSINSLCFHCSGNYLLSSGIGGVKIWDVREGRLLCNVKSMMDENRTIGSNDDLSYPCRATFSPDGRHFASSGFCDESYANKSTDVLLWNIDLPSLTSGQENQHSRKELMSCGRPSTAPSIRVSKKKTINFEQNCSNSSDKFKMNKTSFQTSMEGEIDQYIISDLAGGDLIHKDKEISGSEKQGDYQENQFSINPLEGNEQSQLPQILATTINHIVGQLDIISQTLTVIDKRLSIQEENVAQILVERAEHKIKSEESLLRVRKTNEKKSVIDMDVLMNQIRNTETNHETKTIENRILTMKIEESNEKDLSRDCA